MEPMTKESRMLVSLFFGGLIASVLLTYLRYVVFDDFEVVGEVQKPVQVLLPAQVPTQDQVSPGPQTIE